MRGAGQLFLPPEILILSLVLTGIAVWVARRMHLMAHPVERSSHTIPTPQVGGVAICISSIAGLLILPHLAGPYGGSRVFMQFCQAILLITALGLTLGIIDDLRPLNALAKLLVLLILAAIPAVSGILFSSLAGSIALPLWLGGALALCWVLFFVNAFNFMDGVNGQSAVFTLNALFWMSLIPLMTTDESVVVSVIVSVAGVVAAAVAGFLPWNFPRAATFMGDSGSLPLGGILATMAVFAAQGSMSSFVGYALILSLYIYDVIYTLVRRALRHENLLQAHRSHLYQRLLIATNWSHTRLLAFHLPFYLLSGLAGLGYQLAAGIVIRIAIVGAVAAMLFVYTVLVWRAERAKIKGK